MLAAQDPANLYGAVLPWPRREEQARRPARVPGAYVVLLDGRAVLYVEAGGRGLVSLADHPGGVAAAGARRAGRVRALRRPAAAPGDRALRRRARAGLGGRGAAGRARLPPRPAPPDVLSGVSDGEAGRQRLLRHLELDRPDAAEVEGRSIRRTPSKPEERLRFYSEHFPLVEVDATFYALPSERNAGLWAERTPDHFVFNVKAFGLMTQHAVAAKSLPEPIRDMLPEETASKARVYAARPAARTRWTRCGTCSPARCGRWPTPASWARSSTSSRSGSRPAAATSPTCASSPSARPAQPAIEFRGAGWMKEGKQERTLDLLRDIGATYVVVDEPQGFKTSVPPVVAATSPDLAMIRFHGHNAENWEKRGISAAERFSTSTTRTSCASGSAPRASWPASRSSSTC